MSKKIFAIMAVVLMIATSLVAMAPVSEAKSISKTFDQDVYNQSYMYYDTVTINTEFKIDISSYTGGFLIFKASDGKEREVADALKNGSVYNVSGRISITTEPLEKGSYVVVCNNSYFTYKIPVGTEGDKWQDTGQSLGKSEEVTQRYVSLKLSTGKGDSVKITIDSEIYAGLGAYVVDKILMNSIKAKYSIPASVINNNPKYVVTYDSEMDEKTTLEFKSENVTDYYLVIVINDSNSKIVHHFTGSVEVSGLANTTNPMPFAIVIFIISIGLLAVIVYFGKKKVIE